MSYAARARSKTSSLSASQSQSTSQSLSTLLRSVGATHERRLQLRVSASGQR